MGWRDAKQFPLLQLLVTVEQLLENTAPVHGVPPSQSRECPWGVQQLTPRSGYLRLQEGLSNGCSRSGRAEQQHRNASWQEHQNPTASINCWRLMARKAKLVTSSSRYVVLSKPQDALNTNVETSWNRFHHYTALLQDRLSNHKMPPREGGHGSAHAGQPPRCWRFLQGFREQQPPLPPSGPTAEDTRKSRTPCLPRRTTNSKV